MEATVSFVSHQSLFRTTLFRIKHFNIKKKLYILYITLTVIQEERNITMHLSASTVVQEERVKEKGMYLPVLHICLAFPVQIKMHLNVIT